MKDNHRALELSHDDIEKIRTALEFISGAKMEFIRKNRFELSKTEQDRILKISYGYGALSDDIEEGVKEL